MARYRNDAEVNERIKELREGHASTRCEIALREAMGVAYVNGRHWISLNASPLGTATVDTWSEEWNPHQQEVRMVDNRIGPLFRRVAASTNATKIEAAVSVPRHVRSMQCSRRAAIGQDVLNACDNDVGMTLAARQGSSLRWQIGSALIVVQAARKRNIIGADILTNPDGSPLEVNDQWVRWEICPLSDLIWDASNTSPDLNQHQTLVLERAMTARKFEQVYGPLANFGIDKDALSTMGDIAPHHVSAGYMAGTSIFAAYARLSKEKAIRVLTMLESDPQDPGRWPEMYVIVDPTKTPGHESNGKVINVDNPVNPYGSHGRNIFKLDGFRRGDAVWAWGIPHILMADQDMLNIATSIQFQQLTAVTYGHWLLDTRTANPEEFVESLSEGFGGVLKWDSKSDTTTRPPQYVAPQAPNQEFITIGGALALKMRDAVHITAQNLGQGKSHVDQQTQQMLLQEGSVVMDTIVIQDADEYSDALKLTLGTIRRCIEQPGRMLARLRDHHGLKSVDLAEFLNMTPAVNELVVRVRESSIVSRSTDERMMELNNALTNQVITPIQFRATLAEELERPLIQADELQMDFIKNQLIQVLNGRPWIGLSFLDLGLFDTVVRRTMYGLDLNDQKDVEALVRLEEALTIQRAIAAEQMGGPGGMEQPPAPDRPQGSGLLEGGGAGGGMDMRGGPPASIDPAQSPMGAAGGLPLGIA